MKSAQPWHFICLFALALTGCGGSSSSSSAPDKSDPSLQQVLSAPLGEEEVACPNLVFSPSQAVPGEPVTVTGLPEEMDTISFRVIAKTDDGDTRVDPLFVSVDPQTEDTRFTSPIHPSRDPQGGEVELEAGDGERHCPARTFTIQPLPSAPEDYPITVTTKLEAWVDDTLTTMGYDPQSLLNADPDSLPQARLNLWLAKQFVSSDRDKALPALAKQARDSDSNLVARYLKATGIEQAIDGAQTELSTVPDARLETRPRSQPRQALLRRNDRGTVHDKKAAVGRSVSFSPTASCEEQAFDPDKMQINSTAELSQRIKDAKEGTLLGSDASKKLGQNIGGTGIALNAADSSKLGGASDALGHVGTLHFVATSVDSARAALQPREITEFDVERVDTEWVEDRPGNDPIFWDGARVYAKGSSFNISKLTLQSLVAGMGMASGPIGTLAGAASAALPDAINGVIDEITQDSCVRIRAPEYGPFDVDDPKWTESRIEGSTVELTGDDHQEYKGVKIGNSTLEIALRIEPFALNLPMKERFLVNVIPVNTSLIPSAVNLSEPGEDVTLGATATNPYEDDNRDNFSASVPSGKGVINHQAGNGTRYTVDFRSPSDRDDYPTSVQFTAHHDRLPPGSGDRTYTVPVELGGELDINESNTCLNPGQRHSFSASLEGFADDNQTVSWQASAGSITSTGDQTADYQASGSPGSVDITATADADGSATDSISITVAENCIRKRWMPTAGIVIDGSGVYTDSKPNSNTDCGGDGSHDDDQVAKLELSGALPNDPNPTGDYWYDRTEDLSAQFSHGSTRYLYDSDKERCLSVKLNGNIDASLEYASRKDGTLSASLDSELTTDCQDFGNNMLECADSGSVMSLAGAYYLELTERRQYTLQGELSCNELEGSVAVGRPGSVLSGPGLTASVVRYAQGDRVIPEPGKGTGVETPHGNVRAPQLMNITCDQPNQVVPFEVDFVLTAPPGDTPHQVMVLFQGGIGTQSSFNGKDHIDTYLPAPTSPADFTAGSHTTRADVDFSVKLEPQ